MGEYKTEKKKLKGNLNDFKFKYFDIKYDDYGIEHTTKNTHMRMKKKN